MTKIQIKLLYASYGWPIKDIAKFLDLPESGVRMYLEEENLISSCPAELMPYQDTPANAADSAYDMGIRDLKTQVVGKELSIAPIIATIELSLLQKVMESINYCDAGDTKQLATLVDTFKTLTKDSLINTVVQKTEKSETGNVQVIVPVMTFKD